MQEAMAQPLRPPHDGSLTVVPGFVDFHAEHNPYLPWAKFPSRTKPGEVEFITFAQFSEATHRVAHILRPQRVGNDGEVVTLLIHCDTVLYVTVLAGLMRANIVPLPVSPGNSPEAVANLMEKTDSHRLIITQGLSQTANLIQDHLTAKGYDIHKENLFPLHEVYPHLAANGVEAHSKPNPYPAYDKPYQFDDVALILHSSGSTGLPKPISKTRKIMLQWALSDSTQRGIELGIQWGGMSLPSFHTMGIFAQLYGPLSGGLPVGLYTPQEPEPPINPTPENILETARVTGCDGIITVPSIIETWTQDPQSLNYLASLKLLTFAGGPLSTTNGNKLIEAGVHLDCTYGLTECGSPSNGYHVDVTSPPDAPVKTKWDWEWMEFSKRMKPRWIAQGDGTYELHLLTCDTHQPSVENLLDVKGYATSDLWLPHPTKEGLWKLVGRADDVIVLGSGEKVVPIPQENHIVSSPLTRGAVMFGWGKPQPGVLIEPAAAYAFDPTDEKGLAIYRNLIWPVVEEANRHAPGFAKLFKETIMVASRSKPLPRAAKGTVMRKQALNLYNDEIQQLFQTLEDSTDSQGISPPVSWAPIALEAWLTERVQSLNNGKYSSPDTDIFTIGFDSLSATILRNRLIGALRSSAETNAQEAANKISQNFLYENPTINRLAQAIASLVDPASAVSTRTDPVEEIKHFLEKYTSGFVRRTLPVPPTSEPFTVLLTGSTGNLGSHIVAALLSDQRVDKLYTFDRPVQGLTPHERLLSAFEDRGLPVPLLSTSSLVTLTGDLNATFFGLEEAVYNELHESVTHIAHNAWKVNFNHQLPSFEAQISGTRKLIDFCLEATYSPRLLFTSSISVAHGSDPSLGPVPEALLPDPKVATASGYASSKYVVEQMIDAASSFGLRGTSLRIGQVCGSKTTGAWNTSDWVPVLVKSSITLGCLPDLQQTVDWIPMDAVASVIVDIIAPNTQMRSVLNVVHPHPVLWTDVFRGVRDALTTPIPLISYERWLRMLEDAALEASPALLEALPALQLLPFFQSVGRGQEKSLAFSTNELYRFSPTIRSLEPVNPSHASHWVTFWKMKGFLP